MHLTHPIFVRPRLHRACTTYTLRTLRDRSRCVVGFFGLLHLFGVHAGYVLIPLLLIVAAALPPKLANHGILVGGRVGGGQVHKVAGVDGKEGKGTQEAGDNATKQMTVAATQMTDLA